MLRIDINLLFTVINILIWALIIKYFLFKPVERILEERQRAVETERTAAEDQRKQADRLKAQYETAMSGADQERAQILKQAHEDAKKQYNQMVNDASRQAEQVIGAAKAQAEQEKQRILQQAGGSLSGLIAEAAARISGSQAPGGRDGALYDEFLGKAGTDGETERR